MMSNGNVSRQMGKYQRELIRVKKQLTVFYTTVQERLSFDPVLYNLDLDRLLAQLDGHWSVHTNHLFNSVWDELVVKYGKEFDTEKKPDIDELNDAWKKALRRGS